MINITLPDGNIKKVTKGTTPMDIAMQISEGLARNILCASINGEIWDTNRAIYTDSTLTLHTWNDKEGKMSFWHSSAHIMAEALEILYPDVKFGIGPAIDNGFYYDIETDYRIKDEDLPKIEQDLPKIEQDLPKMEQDLTWPEEA